MTLVAFSGKAGSGKSTAASYLVEHHDFTRVRFAGPLKAMLAAVGLSDDEIEGDMKEKPCALLCGKTPRFAMQKLGTEYGRQVIGADLWVRLWKHAVEPHLVAGKPVVVDDCRFPNEGYAIRALGGKLIRITRPGAGQGAAGHVSEGFDILPDDIIENNATPADLFARLDRALNLSPAKERRHG